MGMSDIFSTMAIIVYGIFVIQFIFSIFIGDIDFDFDVDIDDVVSFKGLTHFLMGFTGWMVLQAEICWVDYIIATFIGLVFCYILYKVYCWCISLQQINTPVTNEDLVGKTAIIRFKLNEHSYVVALTHNGEYVEMTASSENNAEYFPEDKVVISKLDENNILYFNKL
jgi:hypothetical protein